MIDPLVYEPVLPARPWSVGQHILTKLPLLSAREETRWTVFKLAAAQWYLDTLKALFVEAGDLDRFLGVEMALDGFLAAASSSFDAAVAALTIAVEEVLPAEDRTPERRFSWQQCKASAAACSAALSSSGPVNSALEGASEEVPTGWLAVLRRQRNQSTHKTTLSRHFSRTLIEDLPTGQSSEGAGPTLIILPDGRRVDPIVWCEQSLISMRELARILASDIDTVLKLQGR